MWDTSRRGPYPLCRIHEGIPRGIDPLGVSHKGPPPPTGTTPTTTTEATTGTLQPKVPSSSTASSSKVHSTLTGLKDGKKVTFHDSTGGRKLGDSAGPNMVINKRAERDRKQPKICKRFIKQSRSQYEQADSDDQDGSSDGTERYSPTVPYPNLCPSFHRIKAQFKNGDDIITISTTLSNAARERASNYTEF